MFVLHVNFIRKPNSGNLFSEISDINLLFDCDCFGNLRVASNIKKGNENKQKTPYYQVYSGFSRIHKQTTPIHQFCSGISRIKVKLPWIKTSTNFVVILEYSEL